MRRSPVFLLMLLGACGGKPAPADVAATTSAPTATSATVDKVGDDAAVTAEDTGPIAADDAAPIAAEDALVTAEDAAPIAAEDVAPAAPAPMSDDFAALRAVPLTLQYLVNGQSVACQVTDAGVPDTDFDIKVSCTPDVKWTCLAEGYFVDKAARSAPGLWRTTGCYAARPDGLWYFAKCPTDKAPFEDPEAAKGVRMLSNNMLANVDKPTGDDEGARARVRHAVDDHGSTKALDAACTSASDAGMMKSILRMHCASPSIGYVATEGVFTEMDLEGCHDRSRLVAIQAGLVPPAECAVASQFVGAWRFTTRVEAAKDKKLVGAEGHYTIDITRSKAADGTLAPGCGLDVSVAKIGIDGSAFAPDKVQKATVAASAATLGCGYPGLGEACLQFPVTLADAAGNGISARYILALDTLAPRIDDAPAALHGVWQYEGKLAATRVRGTLQGSPSPVDGPLVRFDVARDAMLDRCLMSVGTFEVQRGAVTWITFEDSEAFQRCLYE